jgi:alpha-tubulin suppressor-like RCC1 family protein
MARALLPQAGSLRYLTLYALCSLAAGCTESPSSPTEADARPAQAAAAAALPFYQVSGGDTHTCALTTDQLAYCWGSNFHGKLGIGTADPLAPTPRAVVGTRKYRMIVAGDYHSCAIAVDYRAFCWGYNWIGQLGDGSQTTTSAPVPVTGGLRFRQIATGFSFTCGLSESDQRVYCWGYNHVGQLGDGTLTSRPTPAPLFGGRKFRQVTAGQYHACAITTTNDAYCWGWDRYGQVGNDTRRGRRTKPVLVAGGHKFRQLDGGESHTCGLTTADRVYCWGNNEYGQLGIPASGDRLTPVAVSGGFTFRRVTAGGFHTCGETSDNLVYCWGRNAEGQLGNGGTSGPSTPVKVAGGMKWAQLSAGRHHTCGKTPSSVAYCWGVNNFGQLGQESIEIGGISKTPVPVSGPS